MDAWEGFKEDFIGLIPHVSEFAAIMAWLILGALVMCTVIFCGAAIFTTRTKKNKELK